jgi:hypothetical protein
LIEPKIVNTNLLLLSRSYFAMGEWIVGKASKLIENGKVPKSKE